MESAAQTRGFPDATPDGADVRCKSWFDPGEEALWERHQLATTKDVTRPTPGERRYLPVGRPPSSALGFRRYAVAGPSSVRAPARSSTSAGRSSQRGGRGRGPHRYRPVLRA